MGPDDLQHALSTLWVWVVVPLAVLAAIVLTVRLRLPQIFRLPDAFRAIREDDEGAPGAIHPATAAAMSAVTSYGAAAAVGAATAVSLGGAGAIVYAWLFTFLLAPLRMGEAVLARTAPVGQAGQNTGTLAGRLLDDPVGGLRGIGAALVVLLVLGGFVFYGGTHGAAVLDAAEQLLPGSALTLGLVVAGAAALFALLPIRKFGSVLGWIAAVSLIALFGAALIAFLSDPGRGFGAFVRAIQEAAGGAPTTGAFSGAVAGEIAMAATLHLLPPIAATGAVEGAWHAEAKAKTTRGQASAALLGALAYGVLTTLVGFSLVATDAFARQVEGSRSIREVQFYQSPFETVSQREEESRLADGILRVENGETGIVEIDVGTDRGMVLAPTFELDGEPLDAAVRVHDGVVVDVQTPGPMGALTRVEPSVYDELMVKGRMLPRGGRLLAESMTRGGGAITSRVALAALLLLAALGAAGWGLAIRNTLATRIPPSAARFTAIIPALGLALTALGVVRSFPSWGLVVAGLLSALTSVALIVRAREIQGLLRPQGRAAKVAPAPASASEKAPRKKKKKRR